MKNLSNAELISKIARIFIEKLYSEENISFLTEMVGRKDENLRILSSRFFKYCPSDYAIASVLASNDNRLVQLKSMINKTISKDRMDYLEDLIPQFQYV